ncbi:MAG: T9SS type A sorting domain-containing protein [Bacteroidales bacterium]|nr:T9SS type A sorting domain-containing protein [Bacteroidales bacterium]
MNEIVKRKNSKRGYTLNYICLVFVLIFFVSSSLKAQNESITIDKKSAFPRHEVKGDDYSPSPRDQHETSPAYKYAIPGFTVVQVNIDNSGMNILNDAGNEPSIAYDPTDPNKMAIGWRQFDNINNNFRQAGIGYTYDGGETWTFPGVINPGIFRSDPVLDSDAEGNFYYNSLTADGDDYWCDVYKSTDGGSTWDEGVFAQGGDKQWMTIDKSGGIGSGNIYAFWNASYSICEPDFFTRSVDGGLSYEDCTSIPDWPYWGTTAVNAEGDLYTCGATWGGNFMVAKSSSAQNPELAVSWDFSTSIDLDGGVVGFGGYSCPNPTGILGQVYITVDSSDGPNHGNVYLLCSVDRYSNPDPMDVMFVRSTDGGLTWSNPIQVNDDLTYSAWQWFGTMSVAPDGRIDVVWLDTRDNPGTVLSVLYYAYSLDAGETWSENYPLSETFDPHIGWPQQDKMGDYYEMFSDETGVHLAWAATFNGEQDVYYSLITPAFTDITENSLNSSFSLSQNFPNPFSDQTTIGYKLNKNGFVSLKVFDVNGREVASLVNEEKPRGNYSVNFDASALRQGVYYYRLTSGNEQKTKKLILLD